jgi:hypothetical protein
MATLDGKKTYKNLCKKGFKPAVDGRASDHKWIEFYHEDKLTNIKTKLSHNNQELNDYLIGCMSNQIKLNRNQFISFAKCDLSEKGYIELVKPFI